MLLFILFRLLTDKGSRTGPSDRMWRKTTCAQQSKRRISENRAPVLRLRKKERNRKDASRRLRPDADKGAQTLQCDNSFGWNVVHHHVSSGRFIGSSLLMIVIELRPGMRCHAFFPGEFLSRSTTWA